jgi:hypothetical protein
MEQRGIYTAFSAETLSKNSLGKITAWKVGFPDKKTPF